MSATSNSGEPPRINRLILVGVVFALALALDLWSKAWVWENLREDGLNTVVCSLSEAFGGDATCKSVEVVPGIFFFKYGFNTGAAFSFLRDATWARTFFITVTFAALAYMGYLASQMPTKRAYGFVAVGLIAAGAAGNLHDRFVRVDTVWDKAAGAFVEKHGVVDFLQFYYPWNPEKYWPIFNVADSALVCGVFLLLIYLHFHGAEMEGAEASEGEDAQAEADGESKPKSKGPVNADGEPVDPEALATADDNPKVPADVA